MMTYKELKKHLDSLVNRGKGYILSSDLLLSLEVLTRHYKISKYTLTHVITKESDILWWIEINQD